MTVAGRETRKTARWGEGFALVSRGMGGVVKGCSQQVSAPRQQYQSCGPFLIPCRKVGASVEGVRLFKSFRYVRFAFFYTHLSCLRFVILILFYIFLAYRVSGALQNTHTLCYYIVISVHI